MREITCCWRNSRWTNKTSQGKLIDWVKFPNFDQVLAFQGKSWQTQLMGQCYGGDYKDSVYRTKTFDIKIPGGFFGDSFPYIYSHTNEKSSNFSAVSLPGKPQM